MLHNLTWPPFWRDREITYRLASMAADWLWMAEGPSGQAIVIATALFVISPISQLLCGPNRSAQLRFELPLDRLCCGYGAVGALTLALAPCPTIPHPHPTPSPPLVVRPNWRTEGKKEFRRNLTGTLTGSGKPEKSPSAAKVRYQRIGSSRRVRKYIQYVCTYILYCRYSTFSKYFHPYSVYLSGERSICYPFQSLRRRDGNR